MIYHNPLERPKMETHLRNWTSTTELLNFKHQNDHRSKGIPGLKIASIAPIYGHQRSGELIIIPLDLFLLFSNKLQKWPDIKMGKDGKIWDNPRLVASLFRSGSELEEGAGRALSALGLLVDVNIVDSQKPEIPIINGYNWGYTFHKWGHNWLKTSKEPQLYPNGQPLFGKFGWFIALPCTLLLCVGIGYGWSLQLRIEALGRMSDSLLTVEGNAGGYSNKVYQGQKLVPWFFPYGSKYLLRKCLGYDLGG